MTRFAAIEARLGHRFKDETLLEEALTHPTLRKELVDRRDPSAYSRRDNARLEFLGDAVIDLAVTRVLYDAYPEAAEGILTTKRAEAVRNEALPRLAQTLGLDGLLMMGKGEERNDGGRAKRLADAFEAVIGAVYIDSDFEEAERVLHRQFAIAGLSPSKSATAL